MAYPEITAVLGGWEGFEIVGVRRETPPDTGPRVEIELAPLADWLRRCSRCGGRGPPCGRRNRLNGVDSTA